MNSDAKRVLLVEDDPALAIGVTGALESFGYSVCASVQTGEEAIATAVELRPDVILMDINLKGEMDGVEATEAINARSAVPVIYLSAQTCEATAQKAKLTTHYGYLKKPFDPDELQSAIESTFEKVNFEKVDLEVPARAA